MASISTSPELHPPAKATAPLLVSLPSLPSESLDSMVSSVAEAFGGLEVLLATPDSVPAESSTGVRILPYNPVAGSSTTWTLTAADFLNAYELVKTYEPRAVLILGAEAESIAPSMLRAMADGVLHGGADLVVPRYALPTRAGLVNSAILYPMSRALFGAAPRFPLPLDLCVSARMSERLATGAQRFTAANEPDGLQWPVAEAAVAGYATAEVEVGARRLPQPPGLELDTLLAKVAGSLFAEVDVRAAFWQRARVAQVARRPVSVAYDAELPPDEMQEMVYSFRLAYGNLSEIWSLVLPPQSLLGLKRLSAMPPDRFAMADGLWARIVYDFLLAYRLRTINRGHLLGALTPLYLAWVASHLLRTSGGEDPESQIEGLAAAFETDKAYVVSRWRWPDRFNP